MTVAALIEKLCLKTAYPLEPSEKQVIGCYAGDLLSNVIKKAKQGNVWLTVINNPNTVAVAMLRGLSCIIMCDGSRPTEQAIKDAAQKGIPILLSSKSVYETAVDISRVI